MNDYEQKMIEQMKELNKTLGSMNNKLHDINLRTR